MIKVNISKRKVHDDIYLKQNKNKVKNKHLFFNFKILLRQQEIIYKYYLNIYINLQIYIKIHFYSY